jgi:TP901 family phage tail tape measure protein
LSFRDAAKGAELLARTSLLSTFDSLTNTTEGLIAIINTFELSMDNAGLALEAMNTVSKKYAVESSDLVDVVRRTGGAFRAAGGDVNELFALFTSVRQTTRESAETIATGMRTIFARIQRPETIQYFKDLGIELASIDGKLVGPFEAIQRISNGLRNLGITAGDVRFSEIIEEIGGIRQISKVIPLLTQTKLQAEALATAQNGLAESSEDIRKAQEGFGYQLGVLQKNFQELVHEIVSSSDFKFFLKNVLDLTNGLITLGRTLTDLIPLMGLVFGAQSLGIGFQFARRLS